jgi:hypothetical protein
VSTKTSKKLTHEEYLTLEEYRVRFDAEKAKVQRHYCTLFGFWRSCPFKPCSRARACKGDQSACLKRWVPQVPRDRQFRARQDLLEATPHHIGAPERAAREFMPGGFWRGRGAGDSVEVSASPPPRWTPSNRRLNRPPKNDRISARK